MATPDHEEEPAERPLDAERTRLLGVLIMRAAVTSPLGATTGATRLGLQKCIIGVMSVIIVVTSFIIVVIELIAIVNVIEAVTGSTSELIKFVVFVASILAFYITTRLVADRLGLPKFIKGLIEGFIVAMFVILFVIAISSILGNISVAIVAILSIIGRHSRRGSRRRAMPT